MKKLRNICLVVMSVMMLSVFGTQALASYTDCGQELDLLGNVGCVFADIVKTIGDRSFSISIASNNNGKQTFKSANARVVAVTKDGRATIKGCGITTVTVSEGGSFFHRATKKTILVVVRPRSATLKKPCNNKKGKMKVNWKKQKGVTGYRIQIATNSEFTDARYVFAGPRSSCKTVKVKKGTTYWIRIQTYKGVIPSGWSSPRMIKICR